MPLEEVGGRAVIRALRGLEFELKIGATYPTHKRIRLDAQCCAQAGTICSVTLAIRERRPVFGDSAVASCAVDVLRDHAEKTGVRTYAFCVMPDHAHIVPGPSEECDVSTFIGQFKNLAQRAAWGQGVHGAFWQKRFWDHLLRAEEDLETVVEYVLNNPVRRGLAKEAKDHPYCGSMVFNS